MKSFVSATLVFFLVAAVAIQGCKNPCENELNALKSRVMQFVEDTDPLRKGAQPCGTHEDLGNYDQICDYAVRALDTGWPYFDCNSCDATEIKLCGCFGENVWTRHSVTDADGNTVYVLDYPGVVYCLANYYRTRNMCECHPDFPGDQGNPKDCYVTGDMIRPDAREIAADGVDENCDGTDLAKNCKDKDYDGHFDIACGGDDCNDADGSVYPGAEESPEVGCGDGIDQDCNGADLACTCPDGDGDEFLDHNCGGNDCNDSDDSIYPRAREICSDGIDQDCNGLDLICCPDLDRDSHKNPACGGDDCDDADGSVYPGAVESPEVGCGDGIDQDCNGTDLACTCQDEDEDGHLNAVCGGSDCDDDNDEVYPGAEESPDKGCEDGIDQDCNGADLACTCPDGDGDGYYADYCGGNDCNDAHPAIYPGANEICANGIDDDCSGSDLAPCDCPDNDDDKYYQASCGGSDCDDQAAIRICAQPVRPQLKHHTLQQTDVCDALIESFGCEFYDGDFDQIPDQYDGGAERMTQYLAEDPQCLEGPPGEAAWNEWFNSPRSLYAGGKIYIEWDEGYPEDQDDDGVSDSCDNCLDTPNGFFCSRVVEGRQPFLPYCDANRDDVVTDDELGYGNQKDSDYARSLKYDYPILGDACDRDYDGRKNEDDNCPDTPNGLDCLGSCKPEGELEICDATGDGYIDLSYDLLSLEQTDPQTLQRCMDLLNELCAAVFKCDVDLNGRTSLDELMVGNQSDRDWDTFGNACDNCPARDNEGQEDIEGDGVGDVCDNCLNRPNGYCLEGCPYPPGYLEDCDANADGTLRLEDLEQFAQSDASKLNDCLMELDIGICDADGDQMVSLDDLRQLGQSDPGKLEKCLWRINLDRCDPDGDRDMTIGDFLQLGPNDRDECFAFLKTECPLIAQCDADKNGTVEVREILAGDQKDSDGDGRGDACDPD